MGLGARRCRRFRDLGQKGLGGSEIWGSGFRGVNFLCSSAGTEAQKRRFSTHRLPEGDRRIQQDNVYEL